MGRRQVTKGESKPQIQPKQSGSLEGAREIKIEFGAVNEQVVLAAAIISPEQMKRLTRLIAPDTFLVPEHSAAWQGFRDLTRRGLEYDPATLQGIAPKVDINLLEQLSAARPEVPPNLDYHVTTLFWDRSRATALQGPVPALIEALRDPSSDADRVRAIARQVGATFEGATRKFLRDPAQLVREQTEEIRLRMQGKANFPFGVPGLDYFESIQAASDAGLNTEGFKTGDHPPRRMTIGTAPKKVTLVTGVSGCLTGETIIGINRGGKSRKIRLDQLVYMFNGGVDNFSRWNPKIETMVRCRDEDGFIRLGSLARAFASGIKRVWTITTVGGRKIKATGDHRFLTSGGWRRLKQLSIGDEIFVDIGVVKNDPKPKSQYKSVHNLPHHPFHTRKNSAHKPSRYSVDEHRLVMEAALNKMIYTDFIQAIRLGNIKGLFFINPQTHHVHHLNGDTFDNSLNNLEWLPKSEHMSMHARDSGWKHVTARSGLDRIQSIVMGGMEMTYDLSMAHEPHNFVASDFIVHNSGKTTYVCNIVLGIARQRRRVLVGAWEVGSGMNLEMLAAISLGYSRSALLEGRLDEEMLDKIQKQMAVIGRWVSFFDLPFHKERFEGSSRPSNERNLDIVAGYVADSGCDVFVADLWKRCLVRTDPDDEEHALTRQQAIFEELCVHGIIVHQQRFKDIELRHDKKPTREGNKGSGAYVEVADTMIGTHRPSMFKNVPDNHLEACVLKQRFGRAPLSVEHIWDGDRGLISGGRSIPYETVGDRSGGFDTDFFPTPRPMGNKKQRSR